MALIKTSERITGDHFKYSITIEVNELKMYLDFERDLEDPKVIIVSVTIDPINVKSSEEIKFTIRSKRDLFALINPYSTEYLKRSLAPSISNEVIGNCIVTYMPTNWLILLLE